MLQHASRVELCHAGAEASLRIAVDARTGKFLVDDADLCELNGKRSGIKKKWSLCHVSALLTPWIYNFRTE